VQSERALNKNVSKCDNANCDQILNLKLCAGCKAMQYCSPKCQKQDWKTHKHACKNVITSSLNSVIKKSNGSMNVKDISLANNVAYVSSRNTLSGSEVELLKYANTIEISVEMLNVIMQEISYEIRLEKALVFIRSIKYAYFITSEQKEWKTRVPKKFPEFVNNQRKCKRIIIIKNERSDKIELVTIVCNCPSESLCKIKDSQSECSYTIDSVASSRIIPEGSTDEHTVEEFTNSIGEQFVIDV